MSSSRDNAEGRAERSLGRKTVAIVVADVNVGRTLRTRTIASSGPRDDDDDHV
jgi:hypothetical protein